MHFYTSYYANYNNIPKNYMCIGISQYCPEWFKNNDLKNFLWVKDNVFAPSAELLADSKSGQIDQDEYKKRYVTEVFQRLSARNKGNNIVSWAQLAKDTYSQMSTQYDALVFLCYERPHEFCHRHILAKLFNYYGIECEELGVQTNKPKQKNSSEQTQTTALF